MAIVPIIIGSLQSVIANKLNKETGEVETMTSKDAAMFPLYASGALFGIYLFFKLISKEYINMLLAFYFFLLGVLALTHLLKPVYHKLAPASLPNRNFNIRILEFVSKLKSTVASPDAKDKEKAKESKGAGKKAEQKAAAPADAGDSNEKASELWLNLDFDLLDLVNLAVSAGVGLWYLATRHWLANNAFGLAFAVNAIELLHLNKVATGAILLSGLFIYDIFWVFGTNVMVTVAKSFEAPIKLVFPQDLLENGLAADKFAMLGLGDIVIPGIFVALLLRYDAARGRSGRPYFWCCLAAYCAGLLATIAVMHVFKHAQPALLYLVPCCLGAPLLLALARGELACLLRYEDTDGAAEAAGRKSD